MRKIVEKRPRIVCFVGKGIWDSFIRAAAPPASTPPTPFEVPGYSGSKTQDTPEDVPVRPILGSSLQTQPKKRPSVKKTKSKSTVPADYDLQPYKVVHHACTYQTARHCLHALIGRTHCSGGHCSRDFILRRCEHFWACRWLSGTLCIDLTGYGD